VKVVHISHSDSGGGAANAAYSLHQGLLRLGVDSKMLVLDKKSSDCAVEQFYPPNPNFKEVDWYLGETFVNLKRTDVCSSHFSLGAVSSQVASSSILNDCDIINLHWVAGFCSPKDISELCSLGKPIFWFLHDFRPFTGGCHFPSGCHRYMQSCGDCPQVQEDFFTELSLKSMVRAVSENIVIFTSNSWLADRVSESKVFKNCKVEIKPDDIDTELFKEHDRVRCRTEIGIQEGDVCFLLGAADPKDKRKGVADLLEHLTTNAGSFASIDRMVLLLVGKQVNLPRNFPLRVIKLDRINDNQKLAEVYSAADVLLLPSLEDNSPLMGLGAMSCGTPLLAFSTGGIPELVGGEGFLVQTGDWEGFISCMLEISKNPNVLEPLRCRCRQKIISLRHSPSQAEGCLKSYRDKLSSREGNLIQNSDAKRIENHSTGELQEALIEKLVHDLKQKETAFNQAKAESLWLRKNFVPITDLEIMRRSLSWKITAPLRFVDKFLQKINTQ
jgi:glycosyltransferase involved in cell wall biosynthesis